jgi:hypothetical protein
VLAVRCVVVKDPTVPDLIKLYTSITPLIAASYGTKTCNVHPICRYINRTPNSRGIDYRRVSIFASQVYSLVHDHILIICPTINIDGITVITCIYCILYGCVVPRVYATNIKCCASTHDLRLGSDETQKSCGDYQTHDLDRGQSVVRINPPWAQTPMLYTLLSILKHFSLFNPKE